MLPQTIAHYKIIRKIGSGGMGEVFEAQDTRLGRPVALKILPPEMAADPKRLRRFVQEAKAASMLSHPNITHIYEIGDLEDCKFIAMELVIGQTLHEILRSGPFPIQQLLRIGLQIADALEEAHSKGITHRDIKPGNIMMTQKGHVKILDFGLAKMEWVAQENVEEISTRIRTEPGTLMVTVQYMSPEQALGMPIDHRSDIFSVGAVFYEMATGQRAFSGNTPAATIDKILHSQPDSIARLNPQVPAELERVICKCLRKKADERYQHVRDLAADLRATQGQLFGH
ncbi:MAG TPA: serine/threonine-protein kinase, partial [Acidobacteriota bacterium]|nr:serine/threonine-protein kinase [Acidobacteriota bacterium]